jgi:hypothetical protein
MPSMADFNFAGDDPGPSTDPEIDPVDYDPDDPNSTDDDGVEDDVADYQEPGQDDTFIGAEPTVFGAEGDPNEPEAQNSDVPPIETTAQRIRNWNDYVDRDPRTGRFIRKETLPEAMEGPNEEAEHSEPDPSEVDAGEQVDAGDEVDWEPDAPVTDEVTAILEVFQDPENVAEQEAYNRRLDAYAADPDLADIAAELLEWEQQQLDALRNQLFDYAIDLLDEFGLDAWPAQDTAFEDAEEVEVASFLDAAVETLEADASGEVGEEDFYNDEYRVEGSDDDFFTTPTLLADFADIAGGVDIDTMLVEFGLIALDDDAAPGRTGWDRLVEMGE